jgi:CRISPR-associated protein Cmr6
MNAKKQVLIKQVYLPNKSKNILFRNIHIENKYLLYNRISIDYDVIRKSDKKIMLSLKNVPYAMTYELTENEYYDLNTQITNDMNSVLQSFRFAKRLLFKPDKLVIGIGCESPFSTSLITLHPVYGIPFIPGCAIKGVVRNSYIQEKYNGSEDEAIKNEKFRKLFGCGADDNKSQAAQGNLVFLDAFPDKDFEICWDVQTPHFKDYYDNEGETKPTDDMQPVPLYFPVVKNTSFLINICSLENIELDDEIVKKTFNTYGIGAKTSLGYGLGKIHRIDCK